MSTLTCLPNDVLRAQGQAILRVCAELRDFLARDDVAQPDPSLLQDIAAMEAGGRYLAAATSIPLTVRTAPSDTVSAGPALLEVATGGPFVIPITQPGSPT